MICPVCQSDNIGIIRTKRGLKTDSRVVKCGECGTHYDSVSQITHIIVDGDAVPIDKASGILAEKWEKFKNKKFNQIRMF